MATRRVHTPSVLLVTDAAAERARYAHELRARGYRTFHAADSLSAYQIALERRPVAVVTDVRITRSMDGLELTRRLRNDIRTRIVRIVVLTTTSRPQDGGLAREAGADVCLEKPVSGSFLGEEIVRLVTTEPDQRNCPRCSGWLQYQQRWPILAERREATSEPGPFDRLRYDSGWFCTNLACDYYEVER
jgi:CheY-like chemotaxis protein